MLLSHTWVLWLTVPVHTAMYLYHSGLSHLKIRNCGFWDVCHFKHRLSHFFFFFIKSYLLSRCLLMSQAIRCTNKTPRLCIRYTRCKFSMCIYWAYSNERSTIFIFSAVCELQYNLLAATYNNWKPFPPLVVWVCIQTWARVWEWRAEENICT